MAVEAMSQLSHALNILEDKPLPERPCYRVRNATFSKALVLEEGREHIVMLALGARTGSKDSWHEFKIHSLMNGSWVEHSRGLVRVEQDPQIREFAKFSNFHRISNKGTVAPEDALAPLVHSAPGELWYKVIRPRKISLSSYSHQVLGNGRRRVCIRSSFSKASGSRVTFRNSKQSFNRVLDRAPIYIRAVKLPDAPYMC